MIRRLVPALAGPTPPILVGLAQAASALASAARLLNSSGSGCSRPVSSCISSPCARFPSFSTAGRQRARLGFLDLIWSHPHTFAELTEFCFSRWLHASTTKQREHCATRSHSRTREHFINLAVIAEGRNFDAMRHSPVPTNRNSLQSNGIQTSSTYREMLQLYCKCQTTSGWPRAWFFSRQQVASSLPRKGTSLQHDRFYRVVLSRYRSFAVIVDFVCVFCSIWPQAHRCVCLMQETSNSTFSSTNTLFAQTVRVWIVSARCSVKDSVFSQPVIHCAHKFSSFITVERQTPRNSNCMSTIASLTVSLRLFVNALTKPKRVSLRSATNRYSDPL